MPSPYQLIYSMNNYWTEEHSASIRRYFHGTEETKRKELNNKLCPVMFEMANRCLTSLNVHPCTEHEQDIVVHLVYKVLPRMSEDKLQAALQFLWMSARNYTLTYICNQNKHDTVNIDTCFTITNTDDVADMNIYCSESYIIRQYLTDVTGPTVDCIDMDAKHELDKIHGRILSELDRKLKGQHIMNTTNSVFLLLLRQYILDNDYDVRGFGEYVMKTMRLKLSTYRAIAGRLGLRTKDFNEKIM